MPLAHCNAMFSPGLSHSAARCLSSVRTGMVVSIRVCLVDFECGCVCVMEMERYEFQNVYMCVKRTQYGYLYSASFAGPILRHVLEIILKRNCDGQHGLQLFGEPNHDTYPTKTAPNRTYWYTHTHTQTPTHFTSTRR